MVQRKQSHHQHQRAQSRSGNTPRDKARGPNSKHTLQHLRSNIEGRTRQGSSTTRMGGTTSTPAPAIH
eukprot:11142685-Prorocentrum_lima.AAC.1